MTHIDTRVDRRTALLAGAGMVGAISGLSRAGLPAEAAELEGYGAARVTGALNHSAIDAALQAQGELMKGGVYAFSLARKDVHPTVEGVRILPSFALAAEANFMSMPGGMAMVMGEIPVLEREVNATITRLMETGLQLNALHNHRIQMSPHVMWIHYTGMGLATELASAVRRTLPPRATFDKGGSRPTSTPLPAAQMARAMGGDLRIDQGRVIEVSVDRTNQIRMNGMVIPPAAGVSHTFYFQPLAGGRAAVEGEMPLLAGEVSSVTHMLRQSNIQITALHNHMLTEKPRLFYLHTWAVGNPLSLAQAHRTALNYTSSKRA